MRRAVALELYVAAAVLAAGGCERRGNLRTAKDHGLPPPAPIAMRPEYDPYAVPGDASTVWRPAVLDRRGTVFAPGRAEGEVAPRRHRPAGTF